MKQNDKTKDDVVWEMFQEILPRAKRRKILAIMGALFPKTKEQLKKELAFCKEKGIESSDHTELSHIKEIYDTFGDQLTEAFIINKWSMVRKKRNSINYNTVKPKKEGRDNKDIRVGSGGNGNHKVRWPKKVRGKATWKKFWKLFPQYEGYKSEDEYIKTLNKKYK